jgi:hypothetical protein
VDAQQPPARGYDITINGLPDWAKLTSQDLDVIVDPFVYRVGQFFLEGKELGPHRWGSIECDLGALVNFFDLVVLHDRLPAFNYPDTFDRPDISETFEFRDRLGDVMNVEGDKTLVHVDVEHYLYREAKEAALDQLSRRMDEGPFVTTATANEILRALDSVQYEWEPRLETLEPRLLEARDQRLARFLLGQLVFSGYAQQTGAPHVLSPRRSMYIAAVGLRAELPVGDAQATAIAEGKIYEELARRCRDAGAGWRDEELPWTPSFLPFLLERLDPIREGPDVLLRRAKDLRESKAVKEYRQLRKALTSNDAAEADKARKYLAKAADKVADQLRSNREDLEVSRHVVVELWPKALGAAAGAAGGFVVAGPVGAVGGAVVGVVGEDVLTNVHKRLWGWAINKLPFRSARKLLARSVRAEYELKDRLGTDLKKAWETGRA